MSKKFIWLKHIEPDDATDHNYPRVFVMGHFSRFIRIFQSFSFVPDRYQSCYYDGVFTRIFSNKETATSKKINIKFLSRYFVKNMGNLSVIIPEYVVGNSPNYWYSRMYLGRPKYLDNWIMPVTKNIIISLIIINKII